jgi:hypothetical protein
MMTSGRRPPTSLPAAAADLLALFEEQNQPRWWTLVAHSEGTTDSVHGIYDDPILALIAADRLAVDLNTCEGDAADRRWIVKLVPFYQDVENS